MKRIVVADDNDQIRKLLQVSLSAGGYAVTTAVDGEDALRELRQQPPDLLLLDLQMPVLDGLCALRAIRADPKLRGLPVIAITAYTARESRDMALAAGFDGYLAKPIERNALLGEISRLLPQ